MFRCPEVECWQRWGSQDAAGWAAGGPDEHGGPDLSIRLTHMWILFFRNEAPPKTLSRGCDMSQAAVLRVILQIRAVSGWIRRGKEGMGAGRPVQKLWKLSRYELRADAGVGREKGRGSHGQCYKRRIGRK